MNGKVNAATLGLANLFTKKAIDKFSENISSELPTASADVKGCVKVVTVCG